MSSHHKGTKDTKGETGKDIRAKGTRDKEKWMRAEIERGVGRLAKGDGRRLTDVRSLARPSFVVGLSSGLEQ